METNILMWVFFGLFLFFLYLFIVFFRRWYEKQLKGRPVYARDFNGFSKNIGNYLGYTADQEGLQLLTQLNGNTVNWRLKSFFSHDNTLSIVLHYKNDAMVLIQPKDCDFENHVLVLMPNKNIVKTSIQKKIEEVKDYLRPITDELEILRDALKKRDEKIAKMTRDHFHQSYINLESEAIKLSELLSTFHENLILASDILKGKISDKIKDFVNKEQTPAEPKSDAKH